MKPKLLTPKEAGEMMGMSRDAVKAGLITGRLKVGCAIKGEGMERYVYHITEEQVKAYLAGGDVVLAERIARLEEQIDMLIKLMTGGDRGENELQAG